MLKDKINIKKSDLEIVAIPIVSNVDIVADPIYGRRSPKLDFKSWKERNKKPKFKWEE